jgi:hypothetical protein
MHGLSNIKFLSSFCVSLISLAECNLKHNTDQSETEFIDQPVRDTKLLTLVQKSISLLIHHPIALYEINGDIQTLSLCYSYNRQSVLLQKLIVAQLVVSLLKHKEHRIHNSPPPRPAPSQTNPVHKVTCYLYNDLHQSPKLLPLTCRN